MGYVPSFFLGKPSSHMCSAAGGMDSVVDMYVVRSTRPSSSWVSPEASRP